MRQRPFTARTREHRLFVSVILLLLVSPRCASAIHEQGVAACDECHLVHGDPEGLLLPGSPGEEWALKASSATDLCLSCHANANGAVLAPNPLSPPPELGAGNFGFLLEDNLNDGIDGALSPIRGDAAGHNIVAPERGLLEDPNYTVAPGGTFPTSELGCTSCHDPHGNTNFRMLRGAGPVQDGLATFTYEAPSAIGIALNSGPERDDHHNAYRAGMTEWCANCHGLDYHEVPQSLFEHPTRRALNMETRTQYDRYDGESNPTGGVPGTAYLAEVPFEDDVAAVDSVAGPTPGSWLMCLSCHRAHASSAPSAGRWDFNVSLLDEDGIESGSYAIPNPYDSPDQGTLCRKCHEVIPDQPGSPLE